MATKSLTAAQQGYTGTKTSGVGVVINNSNADIYADGSHMGVVKFTTSINNLLGLSASTFQEVEFQEVILHIKARDAFNTSFICALGTPAPGTNTGKNIPSTYTQYSLGKKVLKAGDVWDIDITNCFKAIPASSNFTPNIDTWYFLLRSAYTSGSQRFWRYDQYPVTITINAGSKTSTYYYTNDTGWEKVQPYYYVNDTDQWVKCNAYYYTADGWVKC